MNMLDWFRKLAVGDRQEFEVSAPTASEAQHSDVGGLNFYTAIEAHQRWKVRLSAYVKGQSEEKLDWKILCKDDACPLGGWLHHEARVPNAQRPLLTRLIEEHAEFHRQAGEVVQLTDAGLQDAALKRLTHGDYARASNKIIASLSQLYLQLTNADQPADRH
jgi:hypothetical protein